MAKDESDNNIWIRNKSAELKTNLINIAKNSGHSTLTGFLRPILMKIVDEAPEHLKRSHKD